MLDGIYFPETLEKRPNWFNGFIEIEKHPKKKYSWSKYVYLPNYYSDKIESQIINPITNKLVSETRHGIILPSYNNLNPFFNEYYSRTNTTVFGTGSKSEIGGRALGTVTLLNTSTGEEENHRYFYGNKDYIVRQLSDYDKPQIKPILQRESKVFEMHLPMVIIFPIVDNGLSIGVISKEGEIHGMQCFSFLQGMVAPEPFGYIDPLASGQGVFSIYHTMTVQLGESVGSDFICAYCATDNEKMQSIYESYGYIKQKQVKFTRTAKRRGRYTFHYPLQTQQKALF